MNRYAINHILLIKLGDLISDNPDMRFSQILSNFGFVKEIGTGWKDEFFLESEDLLKRVEKEIAKLKV